MMIKIECFSFKPLPEHSIIIVGVEKDEIISVLTAQKHDKIGAHRMVMRRNFEYSFLRIKNTFLKYFYLPISRRLTNCLK